MTVVSYGGKMNSLPFKIYLVEENASAEFYLLERSKLDSCQSIDIRQSKYFWKMVPKHFGKRFNGRSINYSDIWNVKYFPRNC